MDFGSIGALVDVRIGGASPRDNNINFGSVVNDGQNGVEFLLVLDEHGSGTRLAHLEKNLRWGIRWVNTGSLATGEDGGHFANDPLGRVEAPNVHSVVLLQPVADERFGDSRHLFVVLSQSPSSPLFGRKWGWPRSVFAKRNLSGGFLTQHNLVSFAFCGKSLIEQFQDGDWGSRSLRGNTCLSKANDGFARAVAGPEFLRTLHNT